MVAIFMMGQFSRRNVRRVSNVVHKPYMAWTLLRGLGKQLQYLG